MPSQTVVSHRRRRLYGRCDRRTRWIYRLARARNDSGLRCPPRLKLLEPLFEQFYSPRQCPVLIAKLRRSGLFVRQFASMRYRCNAENGHRGYECCTCGGFPSRMVAVVAGTCCLIAVVARSTHYLPPSSAAKMRPAWTRAAATPFIPGIKQTVAAELYQRICISKIRCVLRRFYSRGANKLFALCPTRRAASPLKARNKSLFTHSRFLFLDRVSLYVDMKSTTYR